MATIAAVACTDGALLAGDRRVVEDGTVLGSRRHVFDFTELDVDGVGAAAVGDDPDAFRRGLDVALREYATDRGEPGIDAVSRMAAELADETGVDALVAARDDDGRGRIRSVADGVLDERVAAVGTAAPAVLGALDALDEVDLDDAESRVREAFRAAATRDPGTGEDLDVLRLPDAESGETV